MKQYIFRSADYTAQDSTIPDCALSTEDLTLVQQLTAEAQKQKTVIITTTEEQRNDRSN